MSTADCSVCSIKARCSKSNLYLYAPNSMLLERLGSVLTQKGIEFTAGQRTVALSVGERRDAVVEELRNEMSPPELRDLRVTFDLANLMNATSLEQFGQRVNTAWFEEALVQDRFTYYFQPIVNVAEGSLVGHESLIRLPSEDPAQPTRNGQEIVDAAFDRGEIHVFDAYGRRSAILAAAEKYTQGRVFINFTPSSIYDPAFCMASTLNAMKQTTFTPSDVVFEVVESDRIANPDHLRRIADYYREKGFGFALDDVGTGSNSLQLVAEMQPEFIKIDKSLVWKLDTPIGARMLRKLAELGHESGMGVIAEGVETAQMRDRLLEAGIQLMQGYFFGRPAPEMLRNFPLAA